MTISSSLAAGVSGLNANAQRLASISDNIANSSTFGYKRTFTDFHSMVVDSGSAGRYTAGGVRTTTERYIDEAGQLQGSTNPTDIAINGRGFMPVTNEASIDLASNYPLALMTTGSFRPDSEGYLTDAVGNVLLGWPATQDGSFPSFPRDSADGLEPVNIFHNQYSANPTSEMTVFVNLPSGESEAGSSGDPYDMTLEYFGNLGQTESLNITFTPTVPATGASNQWTMSITDSASAGAVIAEYELDFNTGAVGGGTLAAVTALTGAAYDPADGTVDLTVGGNTISLEIGRLNDASAITQLDSTFAPSYLAKNGSTVGNLLGVEIDGGGIVRAVYDSGFTRSIYQVPVIDLPNPNGLKALDGQIYQVTVESGDMFLWDAGQGPAGETVGYSREASTTDVANELTQLIQTQRAYSSNAKIIQTVDEMLQETTNLKR
ncbi:flagellar hook-basal body complex protein [Maribius pontilimi]|uniref:Flagellar hook protein FlgE n=1 Tax=Palleronia pontilimi TaxID=1964209 RepID=A0A934MBG1_9RHOB|nr:flagellar hook-basal body complex protein [Palleronia pontilimi]MBJ3761475.1 flagellar hook-basal body complex protein [Palleronia pontilimi]